MILLLFIGLGAIEIIILLFLLFLFSLIIRVLKKKKRIIYHCPICGKKLELDSLYCENCGHKL